MNKKSENCQKNQRIQVFARCRPLNSIEKKQCSPSVVDVIPDKKIVVKDRNAHREFLFDKVFPPDTKQISVYKAVVGPLIQEVLMGYNCTVFAYGQTGTGKTYTMEGERSNTQCSWEDDPGAGIIPRSLHQLFEDLNQEENVEFSVRVSFLELYNEELFDLLSSSDLSRLRLYEDSTKKAMGKFLRLKPDILKKGSVIIQGLEEIMVNSKDEVYSILERGTARRQTAATMLNASSSRSHTVFSVTVHIKENTIEGEELLKTGKLNLVDLAGSENVGRSGAVDKRAREAGNINQSLLTLGRVITALIEKQPHVPYRESKLTRLLQDSLGGHTKTSIIATISPALCNFDETISTLDYATKAKSITINPELNQKMTKRALIREYTEEIERLRRDLAALRAQEGFYIDRDNYTNLLNEIDEKKNVIKELSDKIDMIKEENLKIEEMFNLTKEELTVTSEKLHQTSKKFEKTSAKLTNTQNALNCTQKVLTKTALERDQGQHIIHIQKKTEEVLTRQAQKLLNVADETTSNLPKLLAKIDRKNAIERTNEEKCSEFRIGCQRNFALMVDSASDYEKKQAAKHMNMKNNIDNTVIKLSLQMQQNKDCLDQIIALTESNNETISSDFQSGSKALKTSLNSLLEETGHQKDTLLKKQTVFFSEKILELKKQINDSCSEMSKCIFDVLAQHSEMIENQKRILSENSENRKKLIMSVNELIESCFKSFEETAEEYKLQKLADSIKIENLKKELSNMGQAMKTALSSCEKLTENADVENELISQRGNDFVSKHEEKANMLRETQKFITLLHNFEDKDLNLDLSALSIISSIMDIQKLSETKNSVCNSQEKQISEFGTSLAEHQQEQINVFSETEVSLKNNLALISDNLLSTEKNISVANSSIKHHVDSLKDSLATQLEAVEIDLHNIKDTVNESQSYSNSTTAELKNEILKRVIECEKFFSDDLQKDIPTGTTPQRTNYSYPRLLAATSPHDRILQRYRSQEATNIAVAINLPLNSSFDEMGEPSNSPVSAETSNETMDVHNTSLSSELSDTDSCASSMSDMSVESGKNKENKSLKKGSRLPKRLPSANIFLKPAPLSSRRPLMATNNTLPERP